MKLDPAGREYATWTISGADDATSLEVTFDGGTTWTALERPTTSTARALVAGPAASGNPVGTVVLPLGRSFAKVRAADSPEAVVRDAGVVDVR